MAPRSANTQTIPRGYGLNKSFKKSQVYDHISKYAKPNDFRAFIEVIGNLGVYIGLLLLPWWSIPLQSLAAIRLFVVFHDCGHRALFSTQTLNKYVGLLLGPFVMTPYILWRDGHDFHHEHSNDLDFHQSSQSAPYTVKDFIKWPKWKQTVYRILGVPIVIICGIAPFAMAVMQPLSTRKMIDWVFQLTIWGALYYTGYFFKAYISLCLAAMVGVYLFHLQHTFDECKREHGRDYFENGLMGSSYFKLPDVVSFLIGYINYHHIHHLNAKVPLYRLKQCHDEAPAGMWEDVKVISPSEGWESLNYVLYDEDKDRLVSWSELDASLAKQKKK